VLIDPPTLEHLQGLAMHFPEDATSALEVRLGAAATPVDLSLRLTRPEQARWMVDRGAFPHLQSFLSRAAKTLDGTSPVSSLWLEFDLARDLSRPALCAGLQGRIDPGWIVQALLPDLQGQPLPERQRAQVETCCHAIPRDARLLYVFGLRPRGADEVRLEILGLDPAGILSYLERVAPEGMAQVAAVLPLFEGVERLHLSLDLNERISPRIGIEGSFARLPHREPGWSRLFDRIVARRLCSPAKRQAVFAWPGHEPHRTASGRWLCIRSLSHVKVVTHPHREPHAKVYLLVTPLQRPPNPVRIPGRQPEG
jgi:hypothetical protein